jgi:hypothetical protein
MAKKINNKKKDGLSLIEKQNQFKECLKTKKKIAIKRMMIKFERLKNVIGMKLKRHINFIDYLR